LVPWPSCLIPLEIAPVTLLWHLPWSHKECHKAQSVWILLGVFQGFCCEPCSLYC
jgi:hypothetical protein